MAEKLDIPEDVDGLIAQLVKQTFEGDNQISSTPKIQRVPAFLRQNTDFAKYCSPKVISFGPIHHRNENFKLGQRYKMQWTSQYIEEYGGETNKNTKEEAAHFLHNIIQDNIEELKKLFAKDVIESYNDKELAWMLFVDGCSLLHFMEHVDAQRPEALNIKLELLLYIWRDTLLLENQLPRRLLELLSKTKGADLEFLQENRASCGGTKRTGQIVVLLHRARLTHILHYTRAMYMSDVDDGDTENGNNVRNQQQADECNAITPPSPEEDIWLRYKNVRDLRKAGIQVMANETDEWNWTNISFTSRWFSGELRLPIFNFNDVSPYLFHNVIAYEMCPDFDNNYECCSYVSFMDSLIDDAEDVKELRLGGVFQNWLGSDEELAKFFNEIGHNLPANMFHHQRTDVVPHGKKFIEIKLQMQKHCNKKWKTWFAELRNTYFNTPWSPIAFLAALLALILAFLQTWYTIKSS